MVTAIPIHHDCVQTSPLQVARRLEAHHLVVPLLLTLAFRIFLLLREHKDLLLRTRIASSFWGYYKARVLDLQPSKPVLLKVLLKTLTYGLASHQSLMRRSHVLLHLPV